MKILPFAVFLFILTCALVSGVCSYQDARIRIDNDVDRALQRAIAQLSSDVVTTDTIRCYRNNITIPELRDTASIAMCVKRRGNKYETQMMAEANCGFLTVMRLSDQRASGTLLFISLLWLAGSLFYVRRYCPDLLARGLAYGGLVLVDGKFMTIDGKPVRLTPMQHALVEMFFTAENHTLSKQAICDRLWPKKPDASDTLYTLVKRTKPVVEANCNLKIESDRGRSYSLVIR